MSKRDDDYNAILAEELKFQRTQILEALSDFKCMPQTLKRIEERLESVEGNVKIIKDAVTNQSKQLINHEMSITVLEAA